MEGLVREMQDPESGVPVRSQKQFLTSIPSAFMGECHRYLRCGVSVSGHHGQDTTVGCLRVAGYDLIEWLMERLAIEESGTGSYVYYWSAALRCCAILPFCSLTRSLARSFAQFGSARCPPPNTRNHNALPEDANEHYRYSFASQYPFALILFALVPLKSIDYILTRHTTQNILFHSSRIWIMYGYWKDMRLMTRRTREFTAEQR